MSDLFPVLHELVSEGLTDDGRRYATYRDPEQRVTYTARRYDTRSPYEQDYIAEMAEKIQSFFTKINRAPESINTGLVLGSGTGGEIDALLMVCPNAGVTGVDVFDYPLNPELKPELNKDQRAGSYIGPLHNYLIEAASVRDLPLMDVIIIHHLGEFILESDIQMLLKIIAPNGVLIVGGDTDVFDSNRNRLHIADPGILDCYFTRYPAESDVRLRLSDAGNIAFYHPNQQSQR